MNSDLYLGIEAIGRTREEILIAQIASYLSYVVLATLAAVVLYEGYKYKMFERDRVTVMAALGMLMTGLMFNYYYMPDLLAISSMGMDETLCDLRISVLKGSVLDFVSMIVFVVLLMVQNMKRACR
jgi:ABC-type sugar transport system permease subunit